MTQESALLELLKGGNVFLTGAPGTGKSYVIERFISVAVQRKIEVALTASTGIAACVIGGITIHSWSGMGIGEELTQTKLANLKANKHLFERIMRTDTLIIDEISMISQQMFESLDKLLKFARTSAEPFGGIQLILSGDFFQLPPVGTRPPQYAFDSPVWEELKLHVCYLERSFRHKQGSLSEILDALRQQRFNRKHLELLMERMNIKQDNKITRLVTHNSIVNRINSNQLSQLNGPMFSYQMKLEGSETAVRELSRSILSPKTLTLKSGAPVMFTTNNRALGYANGTQGEVVGFKAGFPLVRLNQTSQIIKVEAKSWQRELNNTVTARIIQLPLRLAWAITIHKCQGLSLDAADIDLSRSFEYGMGYVAISRLKSLEGLFLSGLNSRSLQLDSRVIQFDQKLLRQGNTDAKKEEIATRLDDIDRAVALIKAGATHKFIKISLGLTNLEMKKVFKQRD